MKIVITGLGYVGTAVGILLAQKYDVVAYDINREKVDLLNARKSPINNKDVSQYFSKNKISFTAVNSEKDAYVGANYIIIATPTDYSEENDGFDTSNVENIICSACKINNNAIFIIKSTVPIGYTEKIRTIFPNRKIVFVPEFLKQSTLLDDTFSPSRLIVGDKGSLGRKVANLFFSCIKNKKTPMILTGASEAEAIKLFSNAYLAMRVAYFNELDSFANIYNLCIEEIITGVGFDPRIGNYYNNPSFGYEGKCLPKDTKQLTKQLTDKPHCLFNAVIESNHRREDYIVEQIMSRKPKSIGIYITADNNDSIFLHSTFLSKLLKVIQLHQLTYSVFFSENGSEKRKASYESDLDEFFNANDIIVANRVTRQLLKYREKIYSRDYNWFKFNKSLDEKHYCNLCDNHVSSFIPGGEKSQVFEKHHIIGGGYRDNVYCPICRSRDRDRWIFRVLKDYTDIFTKKCRVLHIAPEWYIGDKIMSNPNCDYYSGDITARRGQNIIDVLNIQYIDGFFDFIIVNHVLEHVNDIDRAMRELKRVLSSRGKMMVSFPVCADQKTLCDKNIITADDRLKYYGHVDHVRLFGNDYKQLFIKHGLKIDIFTPRDLYQKDEIMKFGFIDDDIIIIARR